MSNWYKYKAQILSIVLLCFTTVSEACGVCSGSYTHEEVVAYRVITLLLTLVPIIGLSVLFYWVYKKYGG
ncbi:MAG: hypothetical protein GY751_26600 [Bacteroidetes bacterium]|nr:hypothetical protein [Bacteroidota bacterium]